MFPRFVPGSHVVFFTVIQSMTTVLLEALFLLFGLNPADTAHPGQHVFTTPSGLALMGLVPLTAALVLITWDGSRERKEAEKRDREFLEKALGRSVLLDAGREAGGEDS